MKILKVENNKGYFLDSNGKWLEIDKINKEGLMNLLNLFLQEEIEIDNFINEFNEELIANKAQQIIYKSIFKKFSTLNENKSKFIDESSRMYLKEIKKYEVSSTGE